jgi:Cu/Ag efflux pump CusA
VVNRCLGNHFYVIFEDGTDIYWARSRVLEYPQLHTGHFAGRCKPGQRAERHRSWLDLRICPGRRQRKTGLAQLRSLQDWTLRYAIESVEGVAERPGEGRSKGPERYLSLYKNVPAVHLGPDLRYGAA